MAVVNQASVSNRLLRFLSPSDFAFVAPHLEFVELPRRLLLAKPNEASGHVYFLDSGIGSIVAASPEGQSAEIGIFGRDGMVPTAVALESESDPFSSFMQVGGTGHRMRRSDFEDAIRERHGFRSLLTRYAQAHLVQAAYTAMSNAVHQIDMRLARWILMCHDRTEGDEIALTHEFLAIMLAVRRPSVTDALHVLEGKRFIKAERALITVRNRAALEAFAQDAYGIPESEYLRLIGKMK